MTNDNKLSESDFKQEIARLGSVPSITKNIIYDLHINGEYIEIYRRSTKKTDKIKLNELYKFYVQECEYKTTTARKYISGRTQSPATAILIALAEKSI